MLWPLVHIFSVVVPTSACPEYLAPIIQPELHEVTPPGAILRGCLSQLSPTKQPAWNCLVTSADPGFPRHFGAVPFASRGSLSAQLGTDWQVLMGLELGRGAAPASQGASGCGINTESISLLTASSHVGCGGSRALGKHLGVCGSRQGLLMFLWQSNGERVFQMWLFCPGWHWFPCLDSKHPNISYSSYSCWFSSSCLGQRCWNS